MSARGFPGLKIVKGRGGRTYRVRMAVPHYEARDIEIRFANGSRMPRIYADGPTSPHRHTDDSRSLCIWHPDDPVEERWVFEDGLLALLNLIQAHLFREAWWREHDEWLGPEVLHDEKEVSDNADPDGDLERRAAS